MSWKRRLGYRLGQCTHRLGWRAHEAIWRGLRMPGQLRLVRWSGETHAGRAGVLLAAGRMDETDFLLRSFFVGAPAREELGTVGLVGLGRRLAAAGAGADLIVARLDRVVARVALPVSAYVRVPEWVRVSRALPASLDELARQQLKVRRELRRVAKAGFGRAESQAPGDVAWFFERMQRPYVAVRHVGAALALESVQAAVKRGALLWCTLGGARVAGAVVEVRGTRLAIRGFGVLDADEALMRRGALAACYAHAFEFAQRSGCTRIDFGGSRPSLTDGVLVYKRRWDVEFDPRPQTPFDYFLRWPAGHASVAAMLRAVPLIARSGAEFNLIDAGAAWPAQGQPIPDSLRPERAAAAVTL